MRFYLGELVWIFFSFVFVFISIASVVFYFDRGLGFGDEGIYLLSARYPDDILENVSAIYVYTGALFSMVGFNPRIFRILGMVLVLGSAVVFWLGFVRLFEIKDRFRAASFVGIYSLLFFQMGAVLYYQWFFATPNNYTLTAFALNVFVGMLMFGLAALDQRPARRLAPLAAFTVAGLVLGLALFTKIPSAICLILACSVIVATRSTLSARQKLEAAAAVIAGAVVWAVGHFALVANPVEAWRRFSEGWSLYQSFGVHVPSLKIALYASEIARLFYYAFLLFLPSYLILAGLFVGLWWHPNGARGATSTIVLCLAMGAAVLQSIQPGVFLGERVTTDGSVAGYLVFHLACLLLLSAVGGYKFLADGAGPTPLTRDNAIFVAFMIVAPIGAAVGTANPIYNVTAFYSVPWFGVIFLLLLNIGAKFDRPQLPMQVGIVTIAAFSASQVIQGSIYNPQQIPTALTEQVFEADVSCGQSLKVDQRTRDLLNDLIAIANKGGFECGDDIVAISYLPGIVYAMGARSPGHPAFLTGLEASEEYSRRALGFASPERLKAALVLINVAPAGAATVLSAQGLRFPEDYIELGSVNFASYSGEVVPHSLWKPKP